MILPRILTSLVLMPIVLGAIWYGSLPYFLLILGVSFLCLWEFGMIANDGGYPNQLIMAFLGGVALLLALYVDGAKWGPLHRAPGPVFVLILFIFSSFLREFFSWNKGHSILRVSTTLFNVILCALLMGHLLLVRELRVVTGEGFRAVGREMTFLLFVLIWATDTGAWVVGRHLGRFKLAPRISPHKTWEGLISGVLLACLAGWLFKEAFLKEQVGTVEIVILAGLVSLTAQFSDLAESLLKRSFGVRNSSLLLPGHGGLLDRFDSFIFAAPFYYYVLIGTGRFY